MRAATTNFHIWCAGTQPTNRQSQTATASAANTASAALHWLYVKITSTIGSDIACVYPSWFAQSAHYVLSTGAYTPTAQAFLSTASPQPQHRLCSYRLEIKEKFLFYNIFIIQRIAKHYYIAPLVT